MLLKVAERFVYATRREICIREVCFSYVAVAFCLCYRRNLLNKIFAVFLSSLMGANNTLISLRFRTLDGAVYSWPCANRLLRRSLMVRWRVRLCEPLNVVAYAPRSGNCLRFTVQFEPQVLKENVIPSISFLPIAYGIASWTPLIWWKVYAHDCAKARDKDRREGNQEWVKVWFGVDRVQITSFREIDRQEEIECKYESLRRNMLCVASFQEGNRKSTDWVDRRSTNWVQRRAEGIVEQTRRKHTVKK